MIDLVKVKKEEQAILNRLIQFYIYEFTKFKPDIMLEADGTFKLFTLNKYWQDSNFHAYFIKFQKELAGFALMEEATDDSPNVIEEFFIIRKFQGHGFGRIAAQRLFSMYDGKWKIVQIQNNYPAQAFWRKTIQEFTSNTFQERYDEKRRSIQEFDTRLLP